LKCFDRAFWLRLNSFEFKNDTDKEILKYQPSINEDGGCPFKDPAITNSFKGTSIKY